LYDYGMRTAATVNQADRQAIILRHLSVVDAQVSRIRRAGLPPSIDPRDLAQVGYVEMIRTIDRSRQRRIPLDKEICAHTRREMVRYLKREWLWRERVKLEGRCGDLDAL
jgi:DNA-directed RNA polymerase specialized sigma subunit